MRVVLQFSLGLLAKQLCQLPPSADFLFVFEAGNGTLNRKKENLHVYDKN